MLCAAGVFAACLPTVSLAGMPSTGAVHNLVVLCRFPDHAEGSADVPAREVYEARYNRAGGHPVHAPGGSVRDFFATYSCGKLSVTSTVVGWVTLPSPSTYYTQKDAKGGLPHWREFHTNALAQIDSAVDFRQFDVDKDGEVDSIAFIHSGGALYQNCAFSLGSRTYTSAEGTKVRYLVNLSSEWSMLGNICHEMTHQMRVADQYDTDHSSAGLGYHCLMAAGTKGWHVLRPHYASPPCAWCRIALGWLTPTLLETYGAYTARLSERYPDIFKITKGFPDGEYLLIENRRPLFGYSGPEVSKGGLAVWHVDEKKKNNNDEGSPGQEGWPQNNHHYKIALLQTDGLYHLERRKSNGDAGDYFFGGKTPGVIGPGPEVYPETLPFFPTTDAYQGGMIRRTPNQLRTSSSPGPEMTFIYEAPLIPLLHAHAHNDYEHARPLLEALDKGFCSIEADVWLVKGQLLVAHDLKSVDPERTLEKLYLEPLLERVTANGGRVYSNGPMVTLFIDFKSEATNTYHVLNTTLKPYETMLTTFYPERTETNAVMLIISGNRPRELMASEVFRYTSYDGRLDDLKNPASPHLISMISDNWGKHFKWRGKGPLPAQEAAKLKALIDLSHSQGRRIRFWNAPDSPVGWAALLAAGVDLINTDNLAGLHDFCLSNSVNKVSYLQVSH